MDSITSITSKAMTDVQEGSVGKYTSPPCPTFREGFSKSRTSTSSSGYQIVRLAIATLLLSRATATESRLNFMQVMSLLAPAGRRDK